jgi:hypothetical protein
MKKLLFIAGVNSGAQNSFAKKTKTANYECQRASS